MICLSTFFFLPHGRGRKARFLLWIILTSLVGLSLIRWADREYRAPVMAVVAFCQVFMLSMIVGLRLGPLEIGITPFATIAEANPNAPVFQSNPDFVPADGTGLNDLLQNYWMVIHPPMLFVGFSTMIVPFAFAIAALWKRKYTQWVQPALPWTLLSVMSLGVGIAMGGYWAYETLSFGGFWAWDPVENSSLVPWLVGVAAIHMMLIQKKGGVGHKAALFLCILSYIADRLLHLPDAQRDFGGGIGPFIRRSGTIQPAAYLDSGDGYSGIWTICLPLQGAPRTCQRSELLLTRVSCIQRSGGPMHYCGRGDPGDQCPDFWAHFP